MIKTLNKLTILGYYQLVGGIVGVIITSLVIINQPIINTSFIALILLGLGFMLYSVYCGFLLIKKDYNKGVNLSIINQALQVIGFSVLGFGFVYSSGFVFAVGLDFTNDLIIDFNFNIPNWAINNKGNKDLTFISINIIAIFILGFIFNAKEILKKKQLL